MSCRPCRSWGRVGGGRIPPSPVGRDLAVVGREVGHRRGPLRPALFFIIIIYNHEHGIICEKGLTGFFLKLKTLIDELIWVKTSFSRQPTEITINFSQWGTNVYNISRDNKSIDWKKLRHPGIKGLMNCYLTFLFLYI